MKNTEIIPCSVEGCETIAKTIGLCNTHYMTKWRAEQRMIEAELAEVVKVNRAPATAFICDQCDDDAVVWWAKGGDGEKATLLCAAHRDATIEAMRLDVRRLELKQ